MNVYMCWSGAMFGQQIDFACGIIIMGAKCIFCSFLFYTLHRFFSSHPTLEQWFKQNNMKLSPIYDYFSLDLPCLLFFFIGLLSFCDLSPINNDNNNQRQIQVANAIVNQPTPAILRYYIKYITCIYACTLLIFGGDYMYKKPDKRINEKNIAHAHIRQSET